MISEFFLKRIEEYSREEGHMDMIEYPSFISSNIRVLDSALLGASLEGLVSIVESFWKEQHQITSEL